jgi:hypothetical protein
MQTRDQAILVSSDRSLVARAYRSLRRAGFWISLTPDCSRLAEELALFAETGDPVTLVLLDGRQTANLVAQPLHGLLETWSRPRAIVSVESNSEFGNDTAVIMDYLQSLCPLVVVAASEEPDLEAAVQTATRKLAQTVADGN